MNNWQIKLLLLLDFFGYLFGNPRINTWGEEENIFLFSENIEYENEIQFDFKKTENLENSLDYYFVKNAKNEPLIQSESALLYVPEKNQIIYKKNVFEKRQIGSLVKIFTALKVENDYENLEETIVVPENLQSFIGLEESRVGLFGGEIWTVREMLTHLLVPSGNDAAWSFAGGFKDENSDKFVSELNNFIKNDLNLHDTNIVNPSGLDEKNQYSTALDVAKASYHLIQNPELSEIVNKQSYVATTTGFGYRTFYNTNYLLPYYFLKIDGVKTGTTEQAGPSLSTFSKLEDENTLICVILGSETKDSRFQDCKTLLTWGNENIVLEN